MPASPTLLLWAYLGPKAPILGLHKCSWAPRTFTAHKFGRPCILSSRTTSINPPPKKEKTKRKEIVKNICKSVHWPNRTVLIIHSRFKRMGEDIPTGP